MKIKNANLIKILLVAISFLALGRGFSDGILANYLNDAYNATAEQRGFVEIPRELPGVLTILVISFLSRLGDIKIAILAQIFSIIGITVLAFYTPSFYVMTGFIFVFSMGIHIFLPLQDTLPLSFMNKDTTENMGKNLGNVKGVTNLFTMVASVIVFFGFKFNVFSFKTEIKWIFVVAAICFSIALVAFLILSTKTSESHIVKPKLILRKEYKYYYILAIMNGVQKQIFLVYSPWFLITILNSGTDTMSLLLIISSICGMFFIPFIGRCLDKYGIKKMLYADAISYIVIYLIFAYLVYQFYVGNFLAQGLPLLIAYLMYIIDRMSSEMGIIRSIYLNRISKDRSEYLSTLSFGIATDHVVVIFCSYLAGLVWQHMGPHWIFIFAASLSLINLFVAKIAPIKE